MSRVQQSFCLYFCASAVGAQGQAKGDWERIQRHPMWAAPDTSENVWVSELNRCSH